MEKTIAQLEALMESLSGRGFEKAIGQFETLMAALNTFDSGINGKLISALEPYWDDLFHSTIKNYFPAPSFAQGPGGAENAAILAFKEGTVTELTPWKYTIANDEGYSFTLLGLFEPGDALFEIHGKILGFYAEDNGVVTASGHGFFLDVDEFFSELETDGPGHVLRGIEAGAEVIAGSDYGDNMKIETAQEDGAPPLIVKGLGGSDNISTGEGKQILMGGDGRDSLVGGFDHDRDILVGGKDGDIFVIPGVQQVVPKVEVQAEAEPEVDHIADFMSGEDIIFYFGAETPDEGAPVGFVAPEQFHEGTMATTEDHRFVYDQAAGELHVDFDGNGTDHEMQLVATLEPGTHLEASDIYVQGAFLFEV